MIARQFSKFILVGAIGFIIDAGILYILLSHTGPYYGRTISFSTAVLGTWLLNRNYVFKKNKSASREGCAYLLIQAIGFGINFIIYSLLIYQGFEALVALTIGAGVSLITNFTGSKIFAFKS